MTARPVAIVALLISPVLASAQAGRMAVDKLPERRVILERIEQPGTESVPVQLERRAEGKLVIQAQDAPIEVTNSEQLSAYVQALPVEAKLSKEGSRVRVDEVSLKIVTDWKHSQQRMERYSEITQAYDKLDTASKRVIAADADQEDLRALERELRATEKTLVELYKTVPPADVRQRRDILEQFREVRRTGKAVYGLNRDDRYPPQAYQRIYENSRGGVAIVSRADTRPHCSGVLIGEDLVLTNFHCIEGLLPGDLEVWFNFEVDLAGNPLTKAPIGVEEFLISTPEQRNGLDFALLRLTAKAQDASGSPFPVQCLSTARVKRDDPLYVVGHPLSAHRTVHDNAFVYFPFKATESEFFHLEVLIASEFLGAEDEAERLAEFRNSYRKVEQAGTTVYENYSQRWGKQPTIGADCDTFHGNSGSPVYSRRLHRVVGLLFDGAPDVTTPFEPGWRSHEAILPISKVIEQLDQALPQWKQRPGVCLQ